MTRLVEPVGILFSEYYFYLAAYIRGIDRKKAFENPDDLYPTIYRIDRIRTFRVTQKHFVPAYASRFQEGEFRRRVQFMYGGRLQKIRFQYTGPSIEAVLDRLPTAEIEEKTETGWIVKAEVFGKGIDMWLRSQGAYIKGVINVGCMMEYMRYTPRTLTELLDANPMPEIFRVHKDGSAVEVSE